VILKQHEATLRSVVGAAELKREFGELAREHSDCSSHKDGGDLGFFARGRMQPAFEKAVEAIAVGEMSGIIETDSGVHLIYRTQ